MLSPSQVPEHEQPQRPRRPRFPWPSFVLGLLLLLGGGGLWVSHAATQPVNILVMGVDGDGVRADVALVARWDPMTEELHLVSLPRDLRVPIPCQGIAGCQTPDKLAHAYAYGTLPGGPGGPELTRRTAVAFLAVPIPYYVRVDYEAFRQAVDALGGVSIDVDAPMHYEDPYQNLTIHIAAGRQEMNGDTALKYVRFRDDGRGDIGRIERTHKFFFALLESARRQGALPRLPGLVADVWPYVGTNLDLSTAFKLAGAARNLDRERLRTATIPGEPMWHDNLWFWAADPAQVADIRVTHLGAAADR